MSTKTHTLSFSVDGHWLADFARTRFDEGAWDRALTLLTDSLEGLSTDQAIAILKGEATLSGNSSSDDGICLQSLPADGELAKERIERVKFMYGDLFRIGDVIWRPYAVVSGWCRDDWHFANRLQYHQAMVGISDDKILGASRSLFYANKPQEDLLVGIPDRAINGHLVGHVLCERFMNSVPFWVKVSTNEPVDFVKNILDTKHLEMRGAAFDGFIDVVKDSNIEPAETSVLAEAAADISRTASPAAFDETKPGEAAKKQMNEDDARKLWETVFINTKKYLETEPTNVSEIGEMSRIFEGGVDRLHRLITEKEWDEMEVIRSKFDELEESARRIHIIKQAEEHGGFFELPLISKNDEPWSKQRFLRVPKNPFILWALRHFNFEDHGKERPKWSNISTMGSKMPGDDVNHTDWVIGAGIPIKEAYSRDMDTLAGVAYHSACLYQSDLVTEYTGHQFTTLSKGKQTYYVGSIAFPEPNARVAPGSIAVVPHAGPEYQLAMESANMEDSSGRRGCIICDVGGKLAHLAVVGREFKCTVIMLPGATKMYREDESVCIDLDKGIIENLI